MNIIIPVFFAIVVPVYYFWRMNAALKARGALADEVDAYFGDKETPEEFKLMLSHAFDACLFHFLPFSVLRSFLSQAKGVPVDGLGLNEKQEYEFRSIITKLMIVNIKLSPITHILLGLVVVVVSVLKAVWGSASSSLSLKDRFENSVCKAVL